MKIERIAEKIIQSSYEIEVCLYSRSIKRCQKLIIFWISFSGKRLNFEGSLQSNQRTGYFWTSKLSLFDIILTFFKQKTWDLWKQLGPLGRQPGKGIRLVPNKRTDPNKHTGMENQLPQINAQTWISAHGLKIINSTANFYILM